MYDKFINPKGQVYMEFRIKEARENAGYSQKELAKIIGVAQNTLHGYESGKHDPKSDLLIEIAKACHVTTDFLLGHERKNDFEETKNSKNLSKEAQARIENHIEKYRLLDQYGKKAVDSVLDVEWRRCKEEEDKKKKIEEVKRQREQMEAAREIATPRMVEKLVYINPAAAGTPIYAESDFERIEFPEESIPCGTDFGIRISGRSMEPTIKDGAIVWIHKTLDMEDGTIGVFMLNSSAVCKRVFRNSDDTIRLESDNPEFGPVEMNEFDELIPVGKVIGIV